MGAYIMTSQLSVLAGGLSFKKAKSYYWVIQNLQVFVGFQMVELLDNFFLAIRNPD